MRVPSKEIVDRIKSAYPIGCRVRLDYMDDPWSKLDSGDLGTVRCVDDMGTIHVAWDCGSSLGVVYGEDHCTKIKED